ncbi:MAG TPA: arylesterase [Accumulibacter sp.]|nr:arylesterase [Accumulibacter sp.]
MRTYPIFRGWLCGWLCTVLLSLAPPTQAAPPTLLVFGDSLSAGYGLRQDAAWPALLAKRLQEKKYHYNVVNVSISGETSRGGVSRIDPVLHKHAPRVVIVALGANDGLRGLSVDDLRANLSHIVSRAQGQNARVLLVGQRIPPNYGRYAQQFQAVFGEVARARKTALVDFMLAGIAADSKYFQADNLHPTAEAQGLILQTLWPALEPLLK